MDAQQVIYYPILAPFKVKKKSKKIKVNVPLVWTEFKDYYIKQLETYLYHGCTKQWQQYVRYILTHKVNRKLVLPDNSLLHHLIMEEMLVVRQRLILTLEQSLSFQCLLGLSSKILMVN